MNALDPINLSIEFVKQQVDPGGGGTTPVAQTGDFAIWAILAIVFVAIIAYCMFKFSRVFNGEYATATVSPKHAKNAHREGRLATTKAILIAAVVGLIACLSITTTTAIAASNHANSLIQPDKIQVAINEETGEVDTASFNFVNTTNDYYLFEKSSVSLSEAAAKISESSDWELTINGMNADLFKGEPNGVTQTIENSVKTLYPGQTSAGTLTFSTIDPEIAKQLIGKTVFNVTLGPDQYVITVPKAETGLVYNGTALTGVKDGVGYELSQVYQATDAGNYTAVATPTGTYKWPDKSKAGVQIPWSIAKATGGFTTPPAPTNPTYSSDPENLVSTGTQKGDGTIVYKLKGTSDPYTENIPQKTDVGIYTVLSHVKEGTNYTESEDVEIQNCNITEAHVAKLTINGSTKAVDYEQDHYYIFPEYTVLKEEAYSVEYEMAEGSPGKVFNAAKISPSKTGIIPVEIKKAQESDIGTHKLDLDTDKYTWKYNDNNVVVDSWVINDGGLTINEKSMVSMTISADKASAYLGDKVTYTVTIANNTSEQITGGNLYLNFEKKHDSISIGPKGGGSDTVEKEIEYTVTPSDFQQSTMEKFFTFELASVGYYNYASKTINLSYKDSTPNPGYQGFYDSNEKTYTATDGNTILGGDVKATNAGNYSVLIILEPGYKWADGYTYDYRIINWKIQKISLDVHFQMEAGQQYFSTPFGSTWDVSKQTITYSTPSGQTVPEGEWPQTVLGGTPYGTCTYKPGMWVDNDPDVNIAVQTVSDKSPNYDITITDTTLDITQAELNLTWPTKSYMYTGEVINIEYNVSGAYAPMPPKISCTTYDKSSEQAKEFKEVGNYTVKASLTAGEGINNNYIIKSGAEPTDTFSITSDQTPKPKAVITQAFFDDPVTIRFVYDTTDYTKVPLVDAVYELTQNPSYDPNENASVYPPWHEYSKLGTIQKASFSASFKDFAAFTGGATFNSLDLWFCDMTGLTSVEGFNNIKDGAIKNLNATFMNCGNSNLETLDINSINFGIGQLSCNSMFESCGVSNIKWFLFDEKKATLENYFKMFKNCSNLVNIENCDSIHLDGSSNTDYVSLFEGCASLEEVDCSHFFYVDHSTETINYMFKGCKNLTNIYLDGIGVQFDWSNVPAANSVDMFEGCEKLPNYESSIAPRDSKYAKLSDDGGFFTKKLEHEGRAFIWNNTLNFYTDQDSSMVGYVVPINATGDDAPWTADAANVTDISYTDNFKTWFTNVRSMHAWFKNTKVTDSIVAKLVDLNTSNIKDMTSLFYGCNEIHTPDFSNLQTTNLLDISYMFAYSHLGAPSGSGKEYVCNLKTNNVKYMKNVFERCTSIIDYYDFVLGDNFNTANVEDMSGMFSNIIIVTNKIKVSNSFSTSKVKNFSRMFYNFSYIGNSIDQFYNMDTSSAIDMSYMFYECRGVEFSLDSCTWDLSNLQDASYMFDNSGLNSIGFLNNKSLNSLNKASYMFSGIKTTSISLTTDMPNLKVASGMFGSCAELLSIVVSSNFGLLEDASNMCNACLKLQSIDFSGSTFSSSKSINLEYFCYYCRVLTSAKLPKCFPNSTYSMFNYCVNLVEIDISFIDSSMCTNFDYMFEACSKLAHIYCNSGTDWSLNKPETVLGKNMFNGCSALEHYSQMSGFNQLSWAKVWDGEKGFFEVKS